MVLIKSLKIQLYPETKSPFLGPKPDWMQLAPATTIQKYFLKMQVVPGTKYGAIRYVWIKVENYCVK
jgi:hypothetical protein